MDLSNSKLPRSIDPSNKEIPDSNSNSNSKPNQIRTCSECKTTKTPVWRVGPNGPKSLCNACGIKYRKRKKDVKVKDTNRKVIELKKNCMLREEEQAAFVLMDLSSALNQQILILADKSAEDCIVHSDSRSLATLLLIRDIQSKRLPSKDANSAPLRLTGFSHSSWIREMQQASDKSIIISEILDSRTRNLVSVSRISDYVLSNELVSMALAMVAEDKQINRVLEELFAEQGNEMCIRPAEYYLYEQEELTFYDIMVRGRERHEIVIGYRLPNADRAIINPTPKMEKRKWSTEDVFVVISLGE